MNTQLKRANIIGTIGQGTATRFAHYALVSVTLTVLLAIAIAMSQTLPHRPAAVISHPDLTMQQRRFLEVNTAWLPVSAPPDVSSATVPFSRARFLEVNTMLGLVTEDAAPTVRSANAQRFIEVNTDLGMAEPPAYPYGEAVMPVRGPR
jgi:hypothetical protein